MRLQASAMLGLCSSAICSVHIDLTLHQTAGHKEVTPLSPFCHLRTCLKAQPVLHASAGCSQLVDRQCWTEDTADLALEVTFATFLCNVGKAHALMQIMLMEVADRIREQLGTSYPQDGPLQKLTAAMPSLTS
jgi:hypothetical protein